MSDSIGEVRDFIDVFIYNSLIKIEKIRENGLVFHTEYGSIFIMYYWPDRKYKILGNLSAIVGSEILTTTEGYSISKDDGQLWKTYKVGTMKGEVEIHWDNEAKYVRGDVKFKKIDTDKYCEMRENEYEMIKTNWSEG